VSNYIKKIILIIFLFKLGLNCNLNAEVLNEVEIKGNKRISSKSIILLEIFKKVLI